MKPEEAFGKILRELRLSKKMSQEELALTGGLDRTFISLLERAQRQPSLTSILQIAKALETAPSEIIRKVEGELNLDLEE